jgi:UDPglucose 6-dehydrogenase
MLQARGARLRAYDPQGRSKAEELLPGVIWCDSAMRVAEGADVLVVLTEWNEFRALDLQRVRELMRGNVLVDLRNIYNATLAHEAGFVYHGIGRTPLPTIVQKQRRKALPGTSIPQVTH